MIWWLLPVFAACAPVGTDPSLIPNLRLAQVQVDPPEAMPGEDVDITAEWMHPRGAAPSVDLLSWACAWDGETCTRPEVLELVPPVVLRDVPPTVDWRVTVPLEARDLLDDAGTPVGLFSFTLVCEQGLCPILDDIEDGVGWELLARPEDVVRAVPLEGTSMASRVMVLSLRDPEARRLNPDFEAVIPAEGPAGGTVAVRVEGAVSAVAYGYTSAGSVEPWAEQLGPDPFTFTLHLPDTPGPVDVLFVLEDMLGGSRSVRQTIQVR